MKPLAAGFRGLFAPLPDAAVGGGSTASARYVFGPVPSRRLGRSLGIDTVPAKTCNWNCVYCQLGRSHPLTNDRKDYFPVAAILAEVQTRLAALTAANSYPNSEQAGHSPGNLSAPSPPVTGRNQCTVVNQTGDASKDPRGLPRGSLLKNNPTNVRSFNQAR